MDKREKQAMEQASRGHTAKAISLLEDLLEDLPADWRARQRVIELHNKNGDGPRAEKHLRELGKQMMADGQYRPAVTVYKQLAKLKPNDGEVLGRLGECQHQCRFINDARKCYVEAMTLLAKKPRKAAYYAQKLLEIDPSETPVRVRLAECLEASQDRRGALREWKTLATEAAERGRPNDKARFLERILATNPDDFDGLVGAAEARIAMGEPKKAFGHLQRAYAQARDSVPVMRLLAQAFEAVGQQRKAKSVLLEAARTAARMDDPEEQVAILEHALQLAPDDDRIKEMLAEAQGSPQMKDLRLEDEPWAQPTTEEEVVAVTRARVLERYGFVEEALEALDEAEASGPVVVCQTELLARMEKFVSAHRVLASWEPPPDVAGLVLTRVAQLDQLAGGAPSAKPDVNAGPTEVVSHEPIEDPNEEPITLSESVLGAIDVEDTDDDSLGQPEEQPESSIMDDASMDELDPMGSLAQELEAELDAAVVDGPVADPSEAEAEGDRLAAVGKKDEAIAAYRRVLSVDPANGLVLMKIGELLSAVADDPEDDDLDEPVAPPPFAPEPEELPPVELGEDDEDPSSMGVVMDVEETGEINISEDDLLVMKGQAHLLTFQWRDAVDAVHGLDSLEALVVRSEAKRHLKKASEGCASLRLAIAEASERDPAYKEALWVLSGLNLATDKLKAARRCLLELEELDPDHRHEDVQHRLRGIRLLEQML